MKECNIAYKVVLTYIVHYSDFNVK